MPSPDDPGPSFRTLSSREVYRNPWITVREDEVELPDGSAGRYGVVDRPDFALVIPREPDGSVWLVEQYRYAIGRRSWEFPQGTWPPGKDRGPIDELARAELREETGIRADTLRNLGHLYTAYGFCSQGYDVWLATGLHQGEAEREPTEQDMVQRLFTAEELEAGIRTGEIFDSHSVAAYGLLKLLGI
ncbi:MAG TPA: NUDIX hydrolase [Mycobacteriales bacterium]|nr:NUDIX hydrolase [Mycobacteriales bacterium]